jgi:hypothetical protein
MTGIERLMKSFGIDPQKIVETFEGQMKEVVQQVKAEFDMLHDRMQAIEAEQASQRELLQRIESGLLHNLNNYLPTDTLERLLLEPDEQPLPGATVIPIQGSKADVA